MLKTIIVDDEKHCTDRLELLLAKYTATLQIVDICHTIESASTSIKQQNPDLVFLDIQLNEKTAFDLLKSVKAQEFQIIFTTAYDKYAIEAIKLSAFDYLLKPIDGNELKNTLNRLSHTFANNPSIKLEALFQNTSREEKKIIITTEKETHFLDVSDIIRCEADGSYTQVYIIGNKTILVSKTLKYFDELLSSYSFFRTHQSHLINTVLIRKYVKGTKSYVLMSDKSQVPIAKRRKDVFLDLIKGL